MDIMATGRRLRALVWLGVAVVALTGCWPAPGAGPDRTGHNPLETRITTATVGSLEEQWSTLLNTATVSGIAVVGDAFYATDHRTVYRFDAATGARRWEVPVTPPPFVVSSWMGPPIVDGDRVLIGWGGPTGSGVDGGTWITQWLDPATGAVLGQGPPGGRLAAVRGDRVLSTREILLASSPDPLAALVVSHRTVAGDSWRGLIPTPNVTLGRDHVYATDGSHVSAYPVVGGRTNCGPTPDLPYACPVWTTPVDGASSQPVLGDGGATVFVTTDGGQAGRAMLYALSTVTGRVRWSVDLDTMEAHTPALAGDRLYVPGGNGRMVVVAADGCGAPTCQPLWSGFVGWTMSEQPTVAGGVVYVTAYDALSGYVYAFDADGCGTSTCSPLWQTWVRGEITTPPVVSGGRLFVGSRWGVNAFGLPADR